MELTLPASILARELSLIQGVVEKRTTHQILTNVLLEAKGETLTLTATDLDTTLVSEITPVAVKSSGSVTVRTANQFMLAIGKFYEFGGTKLPNEFGVIA